MSLGWPELERSVREQALQEMHANEPAWKEYRLHRRGWLRKRLAHFNGPGIAGFMLCALMVLTYRHEVPIRLINVSLGGIAFGLLYDFQFILLANQSSERSIHLIMPMANAEFFDLLWRRFLRSWHGVFWLMLIAYVALMAMRGAPLHEVMLWPAAALLQTLCGLVLAIWMLAFFPRELQYATIPFGLLMFACLFIPKEALTPLWKATRLIPGGWVSRSLLGYSFKTDAGERGWGILTFPLIATLPFAYRKLRRRWLADLEYKVVADQPEPEEELDAVEAVHSATTELADTRVNWSLAGITGRASATWWTTRERVVAEVMAGNRAPDWSKRLLWMWALTIPGILLTRAPNSVQWISFIILGLAAFVGAPTLETPLGFQNTLSSGYATPLYAYFPLNCREISSTLFKANLVRLALWAPAGIASVAAIALRLDSYPKEALMYGLQIVLMLLAAQPAFIAVHFAVIIDSHCLNRQTAWYGVFSALLFFGAAGLGLASWSAGPPARRFLLTAATGIPSVLFGLMTMWMYSRGRMNLLSRPAAK